MMVKGGARAGGMPLYKYVGNRILTALPERADRARLSRVAQRLPRLPRRRARPTSPWRRTPTASTSTPRSSWACSRAGKRIVEVPIPTYYGDEICYVNGLAYARDVTADVVRHWADGAASAVASPRPRPTTYALKADYGSHGVLLRLAGAAPTVAGARRRLLRRAVRRPGPATGPPRHRPGPAEARRRGRAGATRSSRPTSTTRSPTHSTVRSTSSSPATSSSTSSSRTSCSTTWSRGLAPGGEILVSVPNFGHWYPRGRIAVRQVRLRPARAARPWPRPVLHPRLRRDAHRQLRSADHRPATVGTPFDTLADGGPPRRERLASGAARTDRVATRVWPRMFGYQFLYRLEVM